MSDKEMLKEADEWLYSMKCLLSVKTDEEDRAYTQKRIDLFNWLIEQAQRAQELEQQNNHYRDLLESISTTNKVASEIFNKKDGKTLIGPDDILQEILRKVNKRLVESE